MNPVHELLRGSRFVHGSRFTDSGRVQRFTVHGSARRCPAWFVHGSRFALLSCLGSGSRFRVHGRFEGEPLN